MFFEAKNGFFVEHDVGGPPYNRTERFKMTKLDATSKFDKLRAAFLPFMSEKSPGFFIPEISHSESKRPGKNERRSYNNTPFSANAFRSEWIYGTKEGTPVSNLPQLNNLWAFPVFENARTPQEWSHPSLEILYDDFGSSKNARKWFPRCFESWLSPLYVAHRFRQQQQSFVHSSAQLREDSVAGLKLLVSNPTAVHLLSGAVAGGISRTATAPLDRLKVVLQVTTTPTRVTARGTLMKLVKDEGLPSLFRGNGANCLKVVPESAIKFVAYDAFKRGLIRLRHGEELSEPRRQRCIETESSVHLSLRERMVAGALAGEFIPFCSGVAQFAVYPLELVKTRLAASSKNSMYWNVSSTMKHTYQKEGLRAFYRGFLPALLGILPYSGIDMACFETLKRRIIQRRIGDKGAIDEKIPVYVYLGCGAVSSSVGQIVSYPLALVRTRLQVDGVGGKRRIYTGMGDVFRQTIRHEGVWALYRGLLPNLLKAVPAVSLTWATYEVTKAKMHSLAASLEAW